MKTIRTLQAREILDSRGEPTLEVVLGLDGASAIASVPSGASVGVHEAKAVDAHAAIRAVNGEIAAALAGKEFDQQGLDAFLCALDGTPNKSRLGANAILGVSIAFARAQAQENGIALYAYLGSLDQRNTFSMPQPLFNVLNGGKHAPVRASGRRGIDIQECMLAPIGFEHIKEKVHAATECVSALKSLLEQKGYGTEIGDEGGFAPALPTNDEALDLLVSAITQAGYDTDKIKIALDIAASSLYKNGHYILKAGGKEQPVTTEQMLGWYAAMAKKYPLISIEDGFAEDDWDGFTTLQKELGGSLCIVGDDLTVTNTERIDMAIQKKAANACIIKPNQVGTVTEAIAAARAARAAGWKIFASHRSGETMDAFIADFAVGLSCDYIKAGAPTRPERLAKYNRLIEIEEQLHDVIE
ncbi:MAG: phosphopyruvate hydratase [Minisyncoccia bacterium]|jgi:enolase